MERYRKFIVALVGFLGTCITQGLIDGSAAAWIQAGISGVTAFLVYRVANEPSDVIGG